MKKLLALEKENKKQIKPKRYKTLTLNTQLLDAIAIGDDGLVNTILQQIAYINRIKV